MNKSILFCGQSSRKMGELICRNDKSIALGRVEHTMFPSGEWCCQLQDNVRGADVFLLNAITKPANDSLMQLLIMSDAARRASAGRITAVIPYFGYARQDRKDKSRVPISGKLVMDILAAAGFDRIVTMDLHSPQTGGFTNLPLDHLQFRPSLTAALKTLKVDVIVAPDVGGVKRAEDYAQRMDVDLAIISKKRKNCTSVEAAYFIGEVENQNVLIVDDLTESAGTLIEAAKQCRGRKANKVFCAITHGCFTPLGNTRLMEAFERGLIDQLFVSNTVETFFERQWVDILIGKDYHEKVTTVDVSPIFAKAINSIHNNESVSSLFV